MAEYSYPVEEQPMSSQYWTAVTLGIGDGLLDEGGSPYWITGYDNATNTANLRVSTTQGTANATLKGFYHKLDEAVTLNIPAVTVATTYWIALQYDPVRVDERELPVRLGVFTELDRTGGKSYVILYRIVRQPNQLLTDAAVTFYRQRVAPTLTVYSRDRLPDPATVLWGTVAVAYGPEKSVYVCMSDGSADPMRWEPVAGDGADRYVWTDQADTATYTSPPSTGGQKRAIGRKRRWRAMRGRVTRVGGFQPGTTYQQLIGAANLVSTDRPAGTQSWVTAISSGPGGSVGVARVEVTPSGAVVAWVSQECDWISLDGCEWEVPE